MRKTLLTGASGFLGNYLFRQLVLTGECKTLGRNKTNDIQCDLSLQVPRLHGFTHIVHNAGKAHVIPANKQEAEEFDQVNVIGTQNLLSALDMSASLPELVVYTSSVAVYGLDQGENIVESTPLLGASPYAKSKIESEELLRKWGLNRGVPVIILRLPLVVGAKNPKGNLKAMIDGLKTGLYFRPGSGNAKKSMVLAEDVAGLISTLQGISGTFNLTDGHHPSLAELDTCFANTLKKKVRSIPKGVLEALAKIGDVISLFPLNTLKLKKMTSTLTFDDQLAVAKLGWSPRSVLEDIQREFAPNP